METFRVYHDKYLETDVLLLVDVFDNFRTLKMEYYALDPAWFITKPGLTWDAGLKYTKVKLELITDSEMANFIDSMIRGGTLLISRLRMVEMNFTPVQVNRKVPSRRLLPCLKKEKKSMYSPDWKGSNIDSEESGDSDLSGCDYFLMG